MQHLGDSRYSKQHRGREIVNTVADIINIANITITAGNT